MRTTKIDTRPRQRTLTQSAARQGFTLIELLVVIAIIGTLVALLLPAVQQVRESARQVQCRNNLRQISLALHNYHETMGSFPPATVVDLSGPGTGWWSWIARILPQLEQRPIYEQIDFREDVFENCAKYRAYTSQHLKVVNCPSDSHNGQIFQTVEFCPEGEAYALTNYLACRGSVRPAPNAIPVPGNGAFPDINQITRLADVRDGASHTLLVGERPVDPTAYWGWWAAGKGVDDRGLGDYVLDVADGIYAGDLNGRSDLLHYWSAHPEGTYFALCDGSVRFISYSIDHKTLLALGTRNGGEVVGEF